MADILDTAKKAGNAVLDAGENFHENEMQSQRSQRLTKLRVTSVIDQFGRKAWAIKKSGVIFDDGFDTKDAAVSTAKSLARDISPARLTIEYANGRVQDKKNY